MRHELHSQQESFEKRRSTKLSGFLDLENDPEIDNLGSKDDAFNYLASVLDKQHEESSNRTEDFEAATADDKVRKFHDTLQKFARADEPHGLILALLRVQEATTQYCKPDSLGKTLPANKWQENKPLRTYWQLD